MPYIVQATVRVKNVEEAIATVVAGGGAAEQTTSSAITITAPEELMKSLKESLKENQRAPITEE